jgi:hypothetical protein
MYKKYDIVSKITMIKPKFILLDICMIDILGINPGDFKVNGVSYKLIGTINNTGIHYITYIFTNNIYAYDNMKPHRELIHELSIDTNHAQLYLFKVLG